MINSSLEKVISTIFQQHFCTTTIPQIRSVGGGCINECYRVHAGADQLFCKINSANKFPQLFKKEKLGLELIKKQNIIKVPVVINSFEVQDQQLLLLEWITEGARTELFWKKAGEQLAALHHVTNEAFGLDTDNYMGSVPQHNTRMCSWSEFFINNRLQPLVKDCYDKDLLTDSDLVKFNKIYKVIPQVFIEEPPALLHGDLWGGNIMCSSNGDPVLIDPAVYYGHRTIDLGMTTLFGGFEQPFYDAYNYHYPLHANAEEQMRLANLYPLLIHLYLFGTSYLPQVQQTTQQFL